MSELLQGLWFDGKTSAAQPVILSVAATGEVSVRHRDTGECLTQAGFSSLKISTRIGNTARYVYFPDGGKCETRDHGVLDQWLSAFQPSRWRGLAHQLETHSYFVALTLCLVIAFAYSMVTYGLPAATRYIAFKLPASVMNRAATETIELLDKTQLEPSRLDEATRTRVLQHFAPAIAQNPDLHIKVIFRRAPVIGANAFALPDGTVIFTDDIVRLANNDDELLAVLAHEIGHVKYRHALRAAIQGSVVAFGVAMLTGDVSASSKLLASMPLIITNMSYSRHFETEADDNSLIFLDANHIQRHYFVDLLERLGYQAECRHLMQTHNLFKKVTDESAPSSASQAGAAAAGHEDDFFNAEAHKTECDKLIAEHKENFWDAKVSGYFASHPDTKDRTRKFKTQPSQ